MNAGYDPRLPATEDLRLKAQRRMPRLAFDFLEGGAGQERAVARNLAAFRDAPLKPRYGLDVRNFDISAEIFGRSYAMPIGIAPVGLANLLWPGAEAALAKAAQKANIPYVLSTASNTRLEEIAELAGDVAWFQLYAPQDDGTMDHLVGRVAAAGFQTLVVTMDVPVGSKRDRDLRNGLMLPLRFRPRLVADALRHPRWSIETLIKGLPIFENLRPYVEKAGRSIRDLPQFADALLGKGVTWDRIARLRDLWQGPLVLKGILDPEDAARGVELGVDGIWVSNHGGRQFDAAPATLQAIGPINKVIGGRAALILDGGIRGGADVVSAMAHGAQFTFSARSFFYALGALGPQGADHVIAVLHDEIARNARQAGCPVLREIDESWLWP